MDDMKNEKSNIKELERTLDNFYIFLNSVREETISNLDHKEALHFIDFHANNWIDIQNWISSKYSREELKLVHFQFFRLFKEIYWLQFLFNYGSYPTIYRNLRYILEMICQAYFVDSKCPDLTFDEQIANSEQILIIIQNGKERRIFGWQLVKQVLSEVLKKDDEFIELTFHPLWKHLNEYSHPSTVILEKVAVEDFSSLIIDSFNENLAKEVLKTSYGVFDIVNMIVVKKFSRINELCLNYEFLNEWEESFPYTMSLIKGMKIA